MTDEKELNIILKKSDSESIFTTNNNSNFKVILKEPITFPDGWKVSLSSFTYRNCFKVFPSSSIQHIVFYDYRSKRYSLIEIREEAVQAFNPIQLRNLLQLICHYTSPDDSMNIHIDYKNLKAPGIIRINERKKNNKEQILLFISFDLARIMGIQIIKPAGVIKLCIDSINSEVLKNDPFIGYINLYNHYHSNKTGTFLLNRPFNFYINDPPFLLLYADFIQPSIFGSSLAPILKTIQIEQGTYPNNIHYF